MENKEKKQNKQRYIQNRKIQDEIKNKKLEPKTDLKETETKASKQAKAKIMFNKGKEYITANAMLKLKTNKESAVTLQLFCEGFELITKSYLLYNDYTKYESIIKNEIRHDLEKSYNYCKEFIAEEQNKNVLSELKILNEFYTQNRTKFVTSYDLSNNFNTIKYDNLLKLTEKIIKSI